MPKQIPIKGEAYDAIERFAAHLRMLAANAPPVAYDMLGGYVRHCVTSRQIVCRDPTCVSGGRCRRFPKELLPPAAFA